METIQKFPLLVDTTQITVRVNHDEFEILCQDNPELRLELTSTGEVIAMAPTALETEWKNMSLSAQVYVWNLKTRQGEVFGSSGGFTLPNGAIKSPDVMWIQNSKFENISLEETFPVVVPDFVIELRSKSDVLSDVRKKMIEYRENGVRLGWLINPQKNEVEIYRLGQEVEILESPRMLSGEDVLSGLVVDLSKILRLPIGDDKSVDQER